MSESRTLTSGHVGTAVRAGSTDVTGTGCEESGDCRRGGTTDSGEESCDWAEGDLRGVVVAVVVVVEDWGFLS